MGLEFTLTDYTIHLTRDDVRKLTSILLNAAKDPDENDEARLYHFFKRVMEEDT